MGYASYNNFAHVIENDQYFLICCNDCRMGRIQGRSMDDVKELDVYVDCILSKSQSKKARLHSGLYNSGHPGYSISLCVTRFELLDGCFEKIITNLPDF